MGAVALTAGGGIDIASYWRIRRLATAPLEESSANGPPIIHIPPGPSFGDGSHESTQLCLQALGFLARRAARPSTVLDFGSGSGILAIAAARLGARVEAVEIDERALACVERNTRLNGVAHLVDVRRTLSEPASFFDLVLANVLAGTLREYAPAIARRQSPRGWLVLSGLVTTDVPALLADYAPLLPSLRAETYRHGEWRALVFSPRA